MQYKTVTSYPNYEVSNTGLVRNRLTGRVLKPLILTKGYLGVRLYKEGNGKTLKIHRLVALAFVSGHFLFAQVNHIDGNKLNNHCSNLEWCTNTENHSHKMAHGLNKSNRTYSESTYAKVIDMHNTGLSTRKIADATGVSKSRVHTIIARFTN